MRKFIAIAALLMTADSVKSSENPWDLTATVRALVADKYLGFGDGNPLYNSGVVQTELLLSAQNGIALSIWNSTPFKRWNQNLATEMDLGISWVGQAASLGVPGTFGDIGINVGTCFFNEPDFYRIGSDDILKSHVFFSKEFSGFNMVAGLENYTPMPRSSFDGKNLLSLGAQKELTLLADRLSAANSVAFVYDTGGLGIDCGWFFRGSIEARWSVTKQFVLIAPGVNYYIPITVGQDRLGAMLMGGFSYTF